MTVDGKDIREDGWRWSVGSIEGGAYGYAVIWRGEECEPPKVEHLVWDDFVRTFVGSPGVSYA